MPRTCLASSRLSPAARKASSAAATPSSGASGTRKRRLAKVAVYLSDSSARELDRLVYERIRLGILSALSVNTSMSFSELKQLLDTSDGNLSVHARKLEAAGYIKVNKGFADRKPRTFYELTPLGRKALEGYLAQMETILDATRHALNQDG